VGTAVFVAVGGGTVNVYVPVGSGVLVGGMAVRVLTATVGGTEAVSGADARGWFPKQPDNNKLRMSAATIKDRLQSLMLMRFLLGLYTHYI
jgi:hypothetical protein